MQKAHVVLQSLYRQYFERERSLVDEETISSALAEADISEAHVRTFLDDETLHRSSTLANMREQEANGIDAVPFIVIEGKKRDLHLEEAKEVQQYTKALETIIEESG